jgi:hypothetical protein
MRFRPLVLAVLLFAHCWIKPVGAHPGSGIVVDDTGQVFFTDTGHGVVRIAPDGKWDYIHRATDGHWLALDPDGAFSRSQPKYFQRITAESIRPALIFAGGGAPIVVGHDGNLYYASFPDQMTPGGLNLVRETPSGQQSFFAPAIKEALARIDDGVTGLAVGPDGSIYAATWTSLFKIALDGTVTPIARNIIIPDCDEERAEHKPTNRLPYLRGLAVDPAGTTYAAATSCHCVAKITPQGQVIAFLKSERPWSPTGVALHDGAVYILEYTNANLPNDPNLPDWRPRIRKVARDGTVSIVLTLTTPASQPVPSTPATNP